MTRQLICPDCGKHSGNARSDCPECNRYAAHVRTYVANELRAKFTGDLQTLTRHAQQQVHQLRYGTDQP